MNRMSEFPRYQIVQAIAETGLLPLYYGEAEDAEDVCHIIEACYQAGVRAFEFTNRGAFAHETFAIARRFVDRSCPDLYLGIGSVIDAPTAVLFLQCGADFIVSPTFKEEIARVCNRRKTLWIPGCGSLTEISAAEEMGAEIVKLFPGSVFGPSFIRTVLQPCPWTRIMPTGGVTADRDSLEAWFSAGAVCVGMGTQLILQELIERGDFEGITEKVRAVLALIRDIRK